MCDQFKIEFPIEDFNIFSWAVIREELLYRGIEASFEFNENEAPIKLVISMERKISLKEKPDLHEDDDEDDCSIPPLVKQE